MTQRISDIQPDDLEQMNAQRDLIISSIPMPGKHNITTPDGKLSAIQSILDARVFSTQDTYELQSLGVVFGDAFEEKFGHPWVIVDDEYGRDPAMIHKRNDTLPEGRNILFYPITMISKRVEDGEQVQIKDLFNGVAEILDEQFRLAEAEG